MENNESCDEDLQSLMDETVNEEEMQDENVEEEADEEENAPQEIPVHIGTARNPRFIETRTKVIRVLRRDPRIEASGSLPTIGVTNFRSLGPKIKNVIVDILEREIDITLSSETWEKTSNKRLKCDIERMFQMDGLEFLSCPRPSSKRGGGCAIIVNRKNFTVEKLQVEIPHKLEVIWCLVRPREVTRTMQFKEIIACAFYSAPNYRKNAKLVQHLISQMHLFLVKYPRAGFVSGGDRNKMQTNQIVTALPKCIQVVTKFTYKNRKIHDVMLTNMSHLYAVPYIAPAVQPDVPGHGVPSDHDQAVAVPLAGAGEGAVSRAYSVKSSRPLPDSKIREFGQWITAENWSALRGELSSSEQATIFQAVSEHQLNEYFPIKQCRVSNTDKPWISKEIKQIDRWKKEEYRKNGKSIKYLNMLKSYNQKFKSAAQQHLRRNVTDLMEAAPGKAWATLKRMGAQPGECGGEGAFTMTEHLEQNLSLEQSLDRIVHYFSNLSCQHPPLNVELLPDRVKLKLISETDYTQIPVISPQDIWEIQRGRHKTQSAVPGELPPRLRYEFAVELCEPAALIFNNISRSAVWCQDWLVEYGSPLKKVLNPENEESLRIISITNYFSLTYERFILKWLLEYIGDKLDPDQFGGNKGHSVAHYLIEIQNSILYNQDLENPLATILTGVDISKGFNKIEHNECILRISDMGCPNWLLKILVSYLTGRQLIIRWQGKQSKKLPLNSGAGQGTILGLLLFCITFNGAGPEQNKQEIGRTITETRRKRKPMNKGKKKWVDDLTITVPIRLQEELVQDTGVNIVRPVPYHSRTGHKLPSQKNEMQSELDRLNEYCRKAKMSINKDKTKCMIFNRARNHDVMPELYLSDESRIEVVEEMKLVGYKLRSDLSTKSNTEYIVSRAWKRMWIIRRLKAAGANESELLEVLRCQVLSVLQFAIPAWTTSISQYESNRIESVQKTGLYLVYGPRYKSYTWALQQSKMSTMKIQRQRIFEKFTRTCLKSPKFSKWFVAAEDTGMPTRSSKVRFKPVPARTRAFAISAIPQMVALANTFKTKDTTRVKLNSGRIIMI